MLGIYIECVQRRAGFAASKATLYFRCSAVADQCLHVFDKRVFHGTLSIKMSLMSNKYM